MSNRKKGLIVIVIIISMTVAVLGVAEVLVVGGGDVVVMVVVAVVSRWSWCGSSHSGKVVAEGDIALGESEVVLNGNIKPFWKHQKMVLRNENRSHRPIEYRS